METYTPPTNRQRVLLREDLRKLSSMHSSMEQETQKLGQLLEEVREKVLDSSPSSSETPLPSQILETEYNRLHEKAFSKGLTDEELQSAHNMRHLIRYFKELGQ